MAELGGANGFVNGAALAEPPSDVRAGEQTRLSDAALFGVPTRDPEAEERTAVPFLRALDEVNSGHCPRIGLRRDAMFRRSLAAADLIGAIVALLATQLLVIKGWYPAEVFLGLPLLVVVAKLTGLYDRDELVIGKTTLSETPGMFQVATLYALTIALVTGAETNKPLMVGATVASWALLFLSMLAARNIARRMVRSTTPPERCLVIGGQDQASRLAAKLDCHRASHAEIAAYLPFNCFELPRSRHGDFWRFVAARGIDRVIVGHCDKRERVLETVRYFKEHEIKVSVLPDLLEVVGSSVEFDEIHGTTLLGVRDFGLSRSSGFIKRAVDVVVSFLLLLVLAPVMVAIGLAIWATSKGPAFFRQTRVGRDGETFTMLKFRTMFHGADQLRDELAELNETEGLFKLTDDPRVTKVGRFLRRTSLDELPQLFNVLWGQMSLVGPRPLIVSEDRKVEGWYRRRLHLKPGMTGAWQIMGPIRAPLREMVSMDYLYIVNWSVWADVRIVLQTFAHVVRRDGC
jgi:exopolysaccharide biosynthesis polyprenyl glycosylphosphotransferase